MFKPLLSGHLIADTSNPRWCPVMRMFHCMSVVIYRVRWVWCVCGVGRMAYTKNVHDIFAKLFHINQQYIKIKLYEH